MDKTWWGTAVPSTVSSSSWVCVVGAILSVLTNVVEVGMSWGCHVLCVGGGLVLCSGYVLYVVGSVQCHVQSFCYSSVDFRVKL